MTRTHWLLAGLAALLVLALFWLMLMSPQRDELAELQAETEDIEARQVQTASRIASLEAVRDEAPRQEALLAAAHAILPRDPALPSFLRQLQQAADDSEITLVAVAPARPVEATVEGADQSLHVINVGVELQGGYFQLVDFLRRIEDPAITPRGMTWNALNVSGEPEDYPTLEISLQGDVYTLLPIAPAETEVPDAPDADDEDPDADVDVDVDVEVEEDEG
jgi:Tfp pilus assembly protein PilO